MKIPEDFVLQEITTISKHLNLDKTGFFIYEYNNFKTANLRFTIPSESKRIQYEDLMISVVIINEDISPKIFQSILKRFEAEIINTKGIYKALYHSSEESAAIFSELKEIFLKYYQDINDIKGIRLDTALNHQVPWGTHMCYFYQNKEDLMDILVPYIKTGLENNQFCVWVTSEDLNEIEAKEKLNSEIKDFNKYLKKKQIEIFPYTKWYLKEGEFNFQRVLDGWVQKYDYAITQGFDGIRVTGNTVWIKEKDWNDFSEYEEEINNVIGDYRMIVLCTYSAEKYGIDEILGVMKTHQVATIRKEGKWEIIRKYDSVIFS
ncbi:MAG: MEDS domain-containing protein [Candidatus Thorarchaeota archaeon]